MQLNEAQQILKKAGYLLKENDYEVEEVPTNKVYIVVMDGGENDDDYAVFTSMLEAHKWGDNNCKYDYTVKISKMF
jgi:hypothetical protein